MWWDIPLSGYNTLKEESDAMTMVLKSTGVNACKITHHQTNAVQIAGSQGLAPWQLNTMTKHLLQKMHRSYQSECDRETLHVMSGFKKGEVRYVGREWIGLGHMRDWHIRCLLPRYYSHWLPEMHSRQGDKSMACNNFLLEIVPWLVEVYVRDGIYFIADFPSHPMANLLKSKLAGYANWACSGREEAVLLEQSHRLSSIRNFETSTRVVVQSLQHAMDSVRRTLCTTHQEIIDLKKLSWII